MAPEQVVSSRYAKPACDLYSLEITLYEFLTGTLPFKGATATGIFRAILETPPTPLRELRSEVPETLASIVERALEKDAAERNATADDMRRALLPFSKRKSQ